MTTKRPSPPFKASRARQRSDDPGRTPTIFVFQGGGALGAYQWGAYEALTEAGHEPDWVAGISIGAINAALIAGNPPERRLERLRAFWLGIARALPTPVIWADNDWVQAVARDVSAASSVLFGLPGFFDLRPGAAFWPGPMPNPSFYDTRPLAETLAGLVDFELINAREEDHPAAVRLSVGAVDVESGNLGFFDSHPCVGGMHRQIGTDHILASGALPPAFPAVQIDGRSYWDGGIVSNTPLRYVVKNLGEMQTATIFQVDLFSARGKLPLTHADVSERTKDIQYSSRTRSITDQLRQRMDLHRRIRDIADRLTPAQRADPEVQRLLDDTRDPALTLVHLIYRQQTALSQHKDYEFSEQTLKRHWQTGRADMKRSLANLGQLGQLGAGPGPGELRIYDWCHGDSATD